MERRLRDLLTGRAEMSGRPVALGECGLDYSAKNRVDRNQQMEVFAAQVRLALFNTILAVRTRLADMPLSPRHSWPRPFAWCLHPGLYWWGRTGWSRWWVGVALHRVTPAPPPLSCWLEFCRLCGQPL